MDPKPYTQHPHEVEPESKTGRKLKFGCSGCLIVILGIILIGYTAMFQTSLPLKLIAGNIERNTVIDGRRLEINGVGGSLSRGIKIKELIIPGEYGDTTIKNLKLKYEKPIRWFTRGEVIITEISTSSAEFTVANDFFSSNDEHEDETTEDPVGGKGTETYGEEEYGEEDYANDSTSDNGGFFDLRLLKFQNTRIRTVDGSIDLNIPLIHMKGLYIAHDEFRMDEFKIDSNVLNASLADGRKVEIDGKKVSFDQRIDIVIKPEIHDTVIKDIPVAFEFNKSKGRTTTRITAFDGALEQVDFGNDASYVHFNSLSPGDYLKFEEHVMPDIIHLKARQDGELVKLEAGSFIIGRTTFNYDGREFNDAEEEDTITGKGMAGSYEVIATIKSDSSDKEWPPFNVTLTSQPEAPMAEIFAQVYHGKTYDELGAEEKAAIDKLK